MVKVKFVRHIFRDYENGELGAWARLEMRLPYPPFPGLVVHDGKGDLMTIDLVKYDNGEKATYCYVSSEGHDDYKHAKDCAEEWGWKLRELPAGKFQKNIRDLF